MIACVWALTNLLAFVAFGETGALISTYICMAIVWFGRRKLIILFKI